MKIKEAEHEDCSTCNHRTRKSDEEYGCDTCKKPINRNGGKRHAQYLRASVFNDGKSGSDSLEFCSWKCCLIGLKKAKSNYFISLPFLIYDETQKGIRAKDFFDAIKAYK